MIVTNSQLLMQIEERLQSVMLEEQALMKLQRTVGADVALQDTELESAFDALSELLVPALEPHRLDAASAGLHLPSVSAVAIAELRRAIVSKATARRDQLLADVRVTNAETIENEIEIRLAELHDSAAPLERSTGLLEQAPLFRELLAHRYGTPEYAVRFWQVSYYRHWKHADLIVENHGARLKQDSFAAIAILYVREASARDEFRRAINVEKGRLSQVRDLQRELIECQRTIADVEATLLSAARTRIKEHVRPLDDDALASLLRDDPAVALSIKRILGIRKKKGYLGVLDKDQLQASAFELRKTREKLTRTKAKLARPKRRHALHTTAAAERMLGSDRTERWRLRRQRADQARTRIVTFHDYDRWDPVADVLWWDLMTDGRLDGDFIPEVRDRGFRTRHHHVVSARSTWQPSDGIDIS